MDTLFRIADVMALGDFDSGEAHIVTLHHGCKEGPPGVATARFGKFRAGEAQAKCSECGWVAVVIKENGGANIYVREEV